MFVELVAPRTLLGSLIIFDLIHAVNFCGCALLAASKDCCPHRDARGTRNGVVRVLAVGRAFGGSSAEAGLGAVVDADNKVCDQSGGRCVGVLLLGDECRRRGDDFDPKRSHLLRL